MRRRWWIKERRLYRDGAEEIVAGPRFWTYGAALRKIEKWEQSKQFDIEYMYTVEPVYKDSPEPGRVIMHDTGPGGGA